MAANNRNAMRPSGRSPPFLAIGLTVALVILGFNYWSLSVRNGEQADEIAVLESETRLMNAKKLSAEKRTETIQDKVTDLETELSKQKAVVADKMAQMSTLGAENENLLSQKQNCESDYQKCSSEELPVCRKEKEDLLLELSKAKELYEEARNQANQGCDETKCVGFSDAARTKLLDDLFTNIGILPLVTLHQKGVAVGKYEQEVLQAAAQAQGAAPVPFLPNQGGQEPVVKVDRPAERGDKPVQGADQPQTGGDQLNPVDLQQKEVDPQQLGALPADAPKADVPKADVPKADVGAEQALPQVPNPNDVPAPRDDAQLGDNPGANDDTDRIKPADDWKDEGDIMEKAVKAKLSAFRAKPFAESKDTTANMFEDLSTTANIISGNPDTNITAQGSAGNQAKSGLLKGNQSTNTSSTARPLVTEAASSNNISQHTKQNVSKHPLDDDEMNNGDDAGVDDADYDDENEDDGARALEDDAKEDDTLRLEQGNEQDLDDEYDGDDNYNDYNDNDENMADDLDEDGDELGDVRDDDKDVEEMAEHLNKAHQ